MEKNIKTFFKVSNKRSSSSEEKLLKKNHPKEKKNYRENLSIQTLIRRFKSESYSCWFLE